MKNEIFKSDRHFALFGYSVSHGQLLFRSDKRKGYKKNIDILFFDATFLQLFVRLNGITIKLIENKRIQSYDSVDKYLSYDDNNLFELESGDGEKYYVAASFVKIYENDLEFYENCLDGENKERIREIGGS